MIHLQETLARLDPSRLDANATSEVFESSRSGGVTPREKEVLESFFARNGDAMAPAVRSDWTSRLSNLRVDIEPLTNLTPTAPHPEDLSANFDVVWMESFSGDEAQPSFVTDMVRVGMAEGFKVAVHISTQEDADVIRRYVARKLGLGVDALMGNLYIVPSRELAGVWTEDNGWLTAGDDQREAVHFKTMPDVSNRALDLAMEFQRDEGYHKIVADSFHGAVAARDEMFSVHSLGRVTNRPVEVTRCYIEGGNMLSGTLPSGEGYAIVGRDSLIASAFHLEETGSFNVLEVEATVTQMKGDGSMTRARVNECLRRLEPLFGPSWSAARSEKFAQEFIAKIELTKKVMAQDVGVAPEHLFLIAQAEFHNDMQMRPLGAGEILVNDHGKCVELIDEALADPDLARLERDELLRLRKEEVQEHRRWRPILDEIAGELEGQGFAVIRAPGAMGREDHPFSAAVREVNFMNAIPFTTSDGDAVYVTNATSLPTLGRAFEAFMKEQGVDRVRFIGGDKIVSPSDDPAGIGITAAEISFKMAGGLDCREKHGRGDVYFTPRRPPSV